MMQKKNLWWRLTNIGVAKQTTFEEKKITRLLNIFCVLGLPVTIFFCFYNAFLHYFPLAFLNGLMVVGGVSILYINKLQKFLAARLVLCSLTIILFTTGALFYNNGSEYFLILNIISTIVLFKNRYFVILIAGLNAAAFICVKFNNLYYPLLEQVPYWRFFMNLGWALTFAIIALYYYSLEQDRHLKIIETSNDKLQRHKTRLIAQKHEMKLLNETREKLLSVISHDLRAPIGSLKRSLSMFQEDIISKEELAQLTPQLSAQVDILYNTIDNLLQWSQTQMNGIKAHPKSVSLKPLVSKSVSLLLENARQKNIQINHDIPENLIVFADPNQVKVVIRNLISNAIKFSHPDTEINIKVLVDELRVKLKIIDSGVGMNDYQLQQLFQQKVMSVRGTSNETGTGLGLMLCKEFINKNNGSIDVSSMVGQGTTFTISIPVAA